MNNRIDENKKGNKLFFIFIIPLIVILILVIINYATKSYYVNKIHKDTKEVLSKVLNNTQLKTEEEYKTNVIDELKSREYDTRRTSFKLLESKNDEECYLLVHYAEYYTLFQNVFYGKHEATFDDIDTGSIESTINSAASTGKNFIDEIFSGKGRTEVAMYKGCFDSYNNVKITKYNE